MCDGKSCATSCSRRSGSALDETESIACRPRSRSFHTFISLAAPCASSTSASRRLASSRPSAGLRASSVEKTTPCTSAPSSKLTAAPSAPASFAPASSSAFFSFAESSKLRYSMFLMSRITPKPWSIVGAVAAGATAPECRSA